MHQYLNSNSSLYQELAQVVGCKVVGDFWLNNSRFLIIPLDKFSEYSSFTHQNNEHSIVTRFEIEGQSYVILKAQEFIKNAESNLNSLLTNRELEVATLVAQGYSNKQMASLLNISKWTISTHLRRIFMKLGVDSRAAMMYRCASLICTRKVDKFNFNQIENCTENLFREQVNSF